MNNSILYFDQLFDEIFSEFFTFPKRAQMLLDMAAKDDFVAKQLPSYPVSNIYVEKSGTSVLEIAVPGFEKENVSVSIQGELITVTATKKEEEETAEKEGRTYLCRRLAKREFQQSYKMASAADVDKISVELNNGILRIEIPLKEEEKRKPKQLEIK